MSMPYPKPLEELRQKPHCSVSQVKTYILCPEKYHHQYILHTEPSHRPSALAFGTSIHHALAIFYEYLKANKDKPAVDLLKTAFADRWDVELRDDLPVRFDDGQDPRKMKDMGVTLLNTFHDHGFLPDEVVGVEVPFTIDIADPDTGVILDVPLVGGIDLIAVLDGHLVIVEHKTAARKFAEDRILHDPQPTAYQLAARRMGFLNPAITFQLLLKTRNPTIENIPVTRSKAQELELLSTIASVLKGIGHGVFYKNRGWQCADCQYRWKCDG